MKLHIYPLCIFMSHSVFKEVVKEGYLRSGSGILWHTMAYSGILWHTLAYSGITEYYRVLQSITDFFGVLQSTIE